MTIADFRDELKVALGEVIDDAIWSDLAIEYNIRLAANKLKKQTISKMYAQNDMRGLMDMVTTVILDLSTDTTLKYRETDLPSEVFDLPNGGGINYAAYYRPDLPANCPPQVAKAQFWPTTWRELPLIQEDPLQRPCETRPRYIPEQGRVFFFGMNPLVKKVQMGLVLALDADSENPDDVIQLPAERMFDLRRIMLQTGNWVLLQPGERFTNEGADFKPGQPKPPPPPAVSVNDPVLTTPD